MRSLLLTTLSSRGAVPSTSLIRSSSSLLRTVYRSTSTSTASADMVVVKHIGSRRAEAIVSQARGRGREVAARLIREGLDAANMTAGATSGGGASGGLEAARRKSFFGTALASLALVSTIFGTAYVVLTETGRDWLSTQLKDHTNLPGANFIYENFVRWFTDPSRDKLLPDFPPEIASSEHQPRTLILDLEDTLVHLEWSREYGWRTVKRPGVDALLTRAALAGYEVVIFSSGISGVVEPIALALDSRNMVSHRIFRESTTYSNGIRIKDLSRLNRDLKNVIAVDDEASALSWNPENAVLIKPFTEGKDTADTALFDLIPLLEDMAMRDVSDVRTELARLRGLGSGDVLRGFKIEMQQRMESHEHRASKGLGGLMRKGAGGGVLHKPPAQPMNAPPR